ncbi:MAG: transketolase C-terminal domain-containing protein [Coprobacillaceae bacterium]
MENLDRKSISTIRALCADTVQKANSGHPGLPLGAATMAYTLWGKVMHHTSNHKDWVNRDRFVLSGGHGSSLLYSLFHLYNYDLTIDDLKQFRQLDSKTPGHPEYGHTSGVEATTGPLGAGMALAAKLDNKDYKVYVMMGIAEADMIGTAAGLATCGKIPFASTFSVFATGRAFDQIRNSICYPNLNVKIVGTHAGISVGEDGGTHQAIEDIALMRALPNMQIICPADDVEAHAAVLAATEIEGPMYLRMGRGATPTIHNDDYVFQFGKGEVLAEGNDVTIIATGMMVAKALKAAQQLKLNGITARVINMHTIKPLDKEIIIESAKKTGKIVTVEEANIHGGLGSAVSEVIVDALPIPVKIIGVQDKFGKSGNPNELFYEYGLTVENIIDTVKKL